MQEGKKASILAHPDRFDPTRRKLVIGAGAFVASSILPISVAASSTNPKLLMVFLRGALDGLSTVIPNGDPDYASQRGGEKLGIEPLKPALPLDGFFTLNPNMPMFQNMFSRGEASIFHAVASPYRRRSHFDAQDVLETGLDEPGKSRIGWLNRASQAANISTSSSPAIISIGAQVPLILQGSVPVTTWLPPGFLQAPIDSQSRLLHMYEHSDPALARALQSAIELNQMVGGESSMRVSRQDKKNKRRGKKSNQALEQAAYSISQLMAQESGPRIGFVDIVGWDTHANQNATNGRLGNLLGQLDQFLENIRLGFGSKWSDVAVIVATEFGRTVAINGTRGTDHGTGTVAFLAGGAVNGGKVIADWPGLAPANLFQKRDLQPTMDVRSIFSGVLHHHLGISKRQIRSEVFPDRQQFPIANDLIKA